MRIVQPMPKPRPLPSALERALMVLFLASVLCLLPSSRFEVMPTFGAFVRGW